MPEAVLILLVIVIAAWIPGRLALCLFPQNSLAPAEALFASMILGMALMGWCAFVLAELGLFSLWTLGACWLLAVALLAWKSKVAPLAGRPPNGPAVSRDDGSDSAAVRWELALLVLWLPAALWLFMRPHEWITGGADAGVYVSTAAHVSKTGGLLVEDDTLAELDPTLFPALLRTMPEPSVTPYYLFPSFNVDDADAGRIIPDFFHYHPVWQAVAFEIGSLAGDTPLAVYGALLMPGLWAILGSLAIYFTVRQMIGNGRLSRAALMTAFLVLVGLSLNAIQVWFARYPVAETLSQFLLWSALWAVGAWLSGREPLSLWGLMASLSLGLLLLTRIDMLFILALPAAILVWQTARGYLRTEHAWFYAPVALLTAHATVHSILISEPYFTRIAFYVRLIVTAYWQYGLALLLVAGMVTFALVRWGARLRSARSWRPLLAAAAIMVVALGVYGWFVRPTYGAVISYNEWFDGNVITFRDGENLVRLGWYLSPLGVWLGIAGIAHLVWRAGRTTIAMTTVGLFFTLLYMWRIQANPIQIYAMRRYVPMVMPFFIVGAAHAIYVLSLRRQQLWQAVGVLLAMLWLAGFAWSARGFISRVNHQGLTAQLDGLNDSLPVESILIFDDANPITVGDLVGTPLHYFYGHDVYSLRDAAALDEAALVRTIERWQNMGRTVYWVGDASWLVQQGYDYQLERQTLRTDELERTYDHKPFRIIPVEWNLQMARIESR